MHKTIPSQVVYTCDRCGAEGEQYKKGPFCNAGIHIQKLDEWVRGYDGAIGGAIRTLDLCGRCTREFHEWLGQEAFTMRPIGERNPS